MIYALAVLSPGPGVAAIIARSLARGLKGAPAFLAGFVAGDICWMLLTVIGLAAVAKKWTTGFTILRLAGGLYLLYLAIQLWRHTGERAAADAATNSETAAAPFLGGLSITLGNPKAVIFYFAVLPAVVPVTRLDRYGVLQMVFIILSINPLVLGGYAIAAANAQRFFSEGRSLMWLHRILGTALGIAAFSVLVV